MYRKNLTKSLIYQSKPNVKGGSTTLSVPKQNPSNQRVMSQLQQQLISETTPSYVIEIEKRFVKSISKNY